MTLTASLDVRAVVGPSTSSWSIPQILCTHWKMTHIAVASRMVTLAKVSSQVHSLVVVESCTYSLVRPQPILHFLSWCRSPRRLVGGYMWARYTIPTRMGLQHIDEPPLTSGTPPSSTFLTSWAFVFSKCSGLILQKAVQQFLFDADWRDAGEGSGQDALVMDMSTGTGHTEPAHGRRRWRKSKKDTDRFRR